MKNNDEKPFTHREVCGLAYEVADTLLAGMKHVANSITPQDVADGKQTPGGYVSCLTEAVICLTSAMLDIANAIDNVADAMNNEVNRRMTAEHHRHETGDD